MERNGEDAKVVVLPERQEMRKGEFEVSGGKMGKFGDLVTDKIVFEGS